MREIVPNQLPIVASFIEHEHAAELRSMSEIIDALGANIFEKIHADLVRGVNNPDKGRIGMSAEQVLRAIVVKANGRQSYPPAGSNSLPRSPQRETKRSASAR